MHHDQDAAVYVTSVAADLSGVHPQTMRQYERRGLLRPARTRGGNRRYSERDLARLRRIGALTAAGVNLEGVRRIFELEDQLAELGREVQRLRHLTHRRHDEPHGGDGSRRRTPTRGGAHRADV